MSQSSPVRSRSEGSVIKRPRLLSILDDAEHHRLVLVAGPPGSGKTTLLREWVAALPSDDVAWVTAADLGDDGPAAWAAVGEAVRRAWPESAGLPPLRADALDLDALAAMFPSDDARGLHHRYLVIDDAHALRDRTVRRALLQIVDHGPKGLHLVLGSRSDPEMPLHRMRAQGDLLELRDADLRFRADETETFLSRCGVDFLTSEQLGLIEDRTEGWSTGLRLLAISLRRADDPGAFLATFAGTDRNVADYLIHEVLDRQPEDRYRFLLDTAPFDRLTPELCAVVTGQDDALEQLEQLEREHLFVTRVGSMDDSFRYHELFREMLRYVLRSRHRGREVEVLGAAAEWHEQRGEYAEAIDEWLSAGEAGRAVDAMSAYLDGQLDDGAASWLVQRWIDHTQHLGLSTDRWLVLGHAARLGWAKRWDEQADALERARELAADDQLDTDAEVVIEVLSGFLALARSELVEGAEMLESAVQRWSPDSGGTARRELVDASGTRAHLGLATAQVLLGDAEAARATARGLDLQTSSAPTAMLYVKCLLALADWAEGRLRSTRRRIERLGEDAAAFGLDQRTQRSSAVGSLVSGFLAAEEMQFADARRHLEEHLDATTEPMGSLALVAELALVDVVHATGVDDDALARLDLVRRQRRDVGDAVTNGWIDETECRLLLELGQLDAANRLVAQLPELPAFDSARAAVDLASGRLDVARCRLPDRPGASPRYRLERALIEARAACKAGDRARSEVLAEIVRIGEAEGYVRTVLRGGGAVVEQMLGDPQLSGTPYLQGLRGMLEHRPAPSAASGSLAGLIEPLSEREREVMRYLPTRLSCREIAGELYVSVNTVKTHVQAIYRKLGCNTRAAAVERARALHMLS